LNRSLLTKGIEIVGVLFAAFGGFLAGVAPPQAADAGFAVGLSSFLALILLFGIAALSKAKRRRPWIAVAGVLFCLSIAAGIFYWSNLTNLTYEYPPGSKTADHIAGTDFTERARNYRDIHQGTSKSQIVAKFGGLANVNQVWSEESINGARTRLIASYAILVVAIAGALFSLTEGALMDERRQKSEGDADSTETSVPAQTGQSEVSSSQTGESEKTGA
jgi:hypothetical protein